MSKVQRFEDPVAWQKARALSNEIYNATRNAKFAKDFGLVDQIRRAAVSILSNIAEGFERGGRAEFHQFLVVAKASCAELRAQLYVALDAGYIGQKEFDVLYERSTELGRIIGGLRVAVGNQRGDKR